MYGHTWASQYGTRPEGIAADTWAGVLAGLGPEQLASGLRACAASGSEFPPNAPRFRAMCFGLPTFAQVNAEILTTTTATRSPFARLVWSHIDGYVHRHASAKEAERMRRDAYELACSEVMDGKPLPLEAAGTLEAPSTTDLPSGIPATREARIAKLQGLLGENFNPHAASRSMEDLHHEQDRVERIRHQLNGDEE